MSKLPLHSSESTYNVLKTTVCADCGEVSSKKMVTVSKDWFDDMCDLDSENFYISGSVGSETAYWTTNSLVCDCACEHA